GAATAQAAVATAQANLQTAKDAMQDTHVRAPISGTVLELDAVLGTVISSPTNDVGGGTVILKMANLDTVQVSALVDETDVGKVHAAEVRRSGGRRAVAAPTPAATPGPSYIVFALRGGRIVPVSIGTGLTDQDYIEVTAGLAEKDTVLVLSSGAPR